jgi:D-3-phosphoglycerate dehydrogenase
MTDATTPRVSLAKDRIKVVLLEGIHATAVDLLRAEGYSQLVTLPKALAGAELVDAIRDAHFLGIRSRTQLTAEVLAQAPKLTAVGAFCIGTNQIDLQAAMRRGVPVFNAPFSNTRSVAELVLAEIVMLMRGIPQKNAVLHRNGWVKSAAGSHEVRGKTLGIVGYGHIGTQIGVLAEHLGMQVVFADIETRLSLGNARQLPLDAVLEAADVVTLHVPETAATRDMIDAAALARMKPGSHLINASRGTVVDIDALAAALRSGHIAGAAIDVFPVEPQGNDARFESPLVGSRTCCSRRTSAARPGSAGEHRPRGGGQAGALLGQRLHRLAVNFPEVALPLHTGRSRLLHIHRNVPGIMAQVNERLSAAGASTSRASTCAPTRKWATW